MERSERSNEVLKGGASGLATRAGFAAGGVGITLVSVGSSRGSRCCATKDITGNALVVTAFIASGTCEGNEVTGVTFGSFVLKGP